MRVCVLVLLEDPRKSLKYNWQAGLKISKERQVWIILCGRLLSPPELRKLAYIGRPLAVDLRMRQLFRLSSKIVGG